MKTMLDEIFDDNVAGISKYHEAIEPEIIWDPDEKKKNKKKDQRKRIRSTSKTPFRYICNFEYNGRPCCCTGTLIGPRTVLTAAHCVWNRSKNALLDLTKVSLRIVPGRNGLSEPLPSSIASKVIVLPGYTNSREATKNDIAVVHLKDNIGDTIGYWGLEHKTWPNDRRGVSIGSGKLIYHPESGRLKVNLAGYPKDKPDGCGPATCGSENWWTFNKAVLKKDGLLHYYNDTVSGHSGSPVWIKRSKWKGGRVMIAVHVTGDDDVGIEANRGVFIDSRIRSFIRSNLI